MLTCIEDGVDITRVVNASPGVLDLTAGAESTLDDTSNVGDVLSCE